VTKTSFRSVSEFKTLFPAIVKILHFKNNLNKCLYNWEQRDIFLTNEEITLIEDLLAESPEYDMPIYYIKKIKCYFRCSDGNRYKIIT
jgi:hypothetical protein